MLLKQKLGNDEVLVVILISSYLVHHFFFNPVEQLQLPICLGMVKSGLYG